MISLQNGDTLRITCRFHHEGRAYEGALLYAVIGEKLVTWDEKLVATTEVTGIGDAPAPGKDYSVDIDIPIKNVGTFLFPEGKYEVYVKLYNIPGPPLFWFGRLDDVELLMRVAEFSNLEVTYKKA